MAAKIACVGTLLAKALLSGAGFAGPPRRSDVWIAGAWTNAAMKTMAAKLQPTGMTGFTGRPLPDLPPAQRAKKLAWIERRKKLARQLGIRKLLRLIQTAPTLRATPRGFPAPWRLTEENH